MTEPSSSKRLIFLDIDGVLNTPRYVRKNGIDAISPVNVYHLRTIVKRTEAKIIISSTWRLLTRDRMNALEELRHQLNMAGLDQPECVIGMTPNILDWNGGWRSVSRGHEIAVWRLLHDSQDDYIIIDDGLVTPEDRLVKTDTKKGLQDSHVGQALALFGLIL